jgi:multiple antibiotic resistance protein
VTWQLFGEAFVTLFVIMDPPGVVPVFLALTGNLRPSEQRRAAWQAVAVAFGVTCAFAVFGQAILDYLGISLPALQGAGAIVATMVFVRRSDVAADYLAVALAIVAVHLVLWVSMRYSVVILRLLKDSGILLVTRIAGLLLAAIAVQLVADAVRAFVEGG